MFHTSGLNNIIIFKYPSFSDGPSFEKPGELASDADTDEGARPIETGIYIPHHVQTPSNGGYAIYMRGKNYESLLHDHFGVDMETPSAESRRDIEILNLIDSVPSLDAFLLRTCFETEKMAVDPHYWDISDHEVENLRTLIRQRIEPIVRKAMESRDAGSSVRVEKFLESIWNPNLPEAKLFISAFGIDASEAEHIFGAWKGITFYEFQLRKIAKQATAIVAWLKSRDCIPSDIRMHKMWETQMLMYIEKVGKELDDVIIDIRSILVDYDRCFKTFMGGDPSQFRGFLRTVGKKYWLMGYCISSLSSVLHTYERHMRGRMIKKLTFDEMSGMLKQFEVAVDRRRERSTTF